MAFLWNLFPPFGNIAPLIVCCNPTLRGERMGTTLELQAPVKLVRRRTSVRGLAIPLRRRRHNLQAWLVAVIFVGVTGITTSWATSAPSPPAAIAEEPAASDAPRRLGETGVQDPSKLVLLGAALIAIAAAVRRGDGLDKPRG